MLVENSNQPVSRFLPATLEVYELLCVPVIAVDTGFNIIYINEKACEITGYTQAEARNKKLFDIAAPAELKKKLLRLFAGQIFERDFTVRSPLVTRTGRIRNVEWQCRTMFQGIFRAGAVITFVDLTGSDTVLDMARFIAGSASIEQIAYGFMDMLSSSLNLKLARIILHTEDRKTLAFFRAYPHGALRKKPRLALQENDVVPPNAGTFTFRLRAEGHDIGSLELTPYGGSCLTAEDESYVRRLSDIFSIGAWRLIAMHHTGSIPAGTTGKYGPEPAPGNTGLPPGQAGESDIYRHLIDLLPHGVITCSRDGKVTSLNESMVRILGIARSELEGHDIRTIVRRLTAERENGVAIGARNIAICRALRTGNPAMNVRTFIMVKGSRRELMISAIPVRDDAGNVAGCLATVQDLTVISTIVRLGQSALKTDNKEDLIEESLDLIMNALSLRLVSLYLWDGSGLKLKVQKGEYAGMPIPDCRDVPEPMSPTLPSRVYLGRKPLLIKNYRRCASVRLFDPLARRRPISSMAGVPLQADGDVIGVLVAATGEDQPMDESQLAELSAMCSQLSMGIFRASPPDTQR